jgi:hypothetical protein
MELVAILFLIGLGYGFKGTVDRVRSENRASRDAKVKEAAKAAGGKLPRHQRAAVVRQHTRGWWAREVSGGFPAARTGWHAGWIAHKTALARQQVIREEARTEHAETQTSFRKDLAEHQKRQRAAKAELDAQLAEWNHQVPDVPVQGRRAVQEAADEVTRKREEKAARKRRNAPLPATGTETPVPPLPADAVREAHAAPDPAKLWVFDSPESTRPAVREDARPDDSAHLRPGERRCEGCGGRGSAQGGTCPACRGFGSAPPSPMSPVAPADAVCTACGNTGRPGDPVLADPGGNIHLSHAREQQEAYWDRLNRMRQAEREPGPDAARNPQPICTSPECAGYGKPWDQHPTTTTWTADDERHGAIDDAVIGADHGFEGEFDTHPSPTTTGGAPVTDTNYTGILNRANARATEAEQDAALLGIRLQTSFTDADGMQAAKVDSATLSAQAELIERLTSAKSAVDAVGEQAAVVAQTVQRGHGGIQAAVDDAPIAQPAQPEFYGGS